MDYYEMLRQDAKTKAPRPEIKLTLTDEQTRRLTRMAYETGLDTPGALLDSFVADLTGCQRNGSDEAGLANEWRRRTFGYEMQTVYFRAFLAEDYPYPEDYQDILNDEEWFDEIYDNYQMSACLDRIQNTDECKALLLKLAAEYEQQITGQKP